jgi:hypothetical protein
MDEILSSSHRKQSASKSTLRGVVPLDQVMGDDDEDTNLLRELAARASAYLLSYNWCYAIEESYFGDGVGGIVAVFLFRITPSRPNVDEWLWVVVGDLPPAYFVTDDLKTPYQVLEAYIWHKSRWVRSAKRGKEPPEEVMPVGVHATPEWARDLHSRLKFVKQEVLPRFRKDSEMRSLKVSGGGKRAAGRPRRKV